MAPATLEYELGRYGDRTYFLVGRATPGFDDPESFAVTVAYNDPSTGEAVQVARIDTAHGETHFDRLYRRGEPSEPVECTFWEAMERLESNWRTYARGFENKG